MNQESIKIEMDSFDLEQMLIGVNLICVGLMSNAFDWALNGALKVDKTASEQENAYAWMIAHYTEVCGAVQTVEAITRMITVGIANDDIHIVSGDRLTERPLRAI